MPKVLRLILGFSALPLIIFGGILLAQLSEEILAVLFCVVLLSLCTILGVLFMEGSDA